MSKRAIIILLIITNLLAIFFLLNIHFNISQVKKKRKLEESYMDTLKYDDNMSYMEQTELFNTYKTKKATIVMLGNSFTQRVHWDELLQREDVVNRGIGGDVSEGYLHRMLSVTNLQPKVCFVEAGANDINKKIPVDTTFKNITRIINELKSRNIDIVVTKCFYVSEKFPDYENYNLRVDSLNEKLDKLRGSVHIIDINAEISANHKRKPEFTIADGIHFNAAAYLVWKEEIERKLVELGIPAQ